MKSHSYRSPSFRRVVAAFACVFACAQSVLSAANADSIAGLRSDFATPPDSARPWVYWTWLNSNVSREGITADLEAMQRVGIGGALILDVDQGTPPGPVKFFDEGWRELFGHTISEASRLGLEINMNNGVGYFGSGGPWVKPEQGMQSVFASETLVPGGASWTDRLPKPARTGPDYRDLAVYAVPVTPPPVLKADGKPKPLIEDFDMKALFWKHWVGYRGTRSAAPDATVPPDTIIPRDRVIDLSERFAPDGTLTWDAPPGDWVVLRIGHAKNGSRIGPALPGLAGLETDKLNAAATAQHFDAFVKTLRDTIPPALRPAFAAIHIDSWEGGGQNWTAAMREEFTRRRGYDPLPYLPILTGRVLGDLPTTERFLWDLRQTVSELMVANYVAEFQRLARREGLRFTFECYTTSGNDLDAAAYVDEPMAEFWTPTGIGTDFSPSLKSMSSAAHLNGTAVVGAEAYTSTAGEKWLWHPAMLKAIGDSAFAQGANRFVFHRYAAQRFTDRTPGVQMGPWGLHYERTNTWWDWSGPWHAYLARCQHLLRQGEFVADVLRLQDEEPLERFKPAPLKGYDYDVCGTDTFRRLTVRDGQVALPSGRAYRLLTLGHNGTMTLPTLRHLRDLVRDGAAILGAPPRATPGLTDFPRADEELKELAAELWGDGPPVAERAVGRGKVFSGIDAKAVLVRLGVAPDIATTAKLSWIHRRVAGTDLYFVANPGDRPLRADVVFRASGRAPEFWQPETGLITRAARFAPVADGTRVSLALGAAESVFVVFPAQTPHVDPVDTFTRDGGDPFAANAAQISVQSARYGVPGDPKRTRDVLEKVRALLAGDSDGFAVGVLAKGDDPAFGVVKTLELAYTAGGRAFSYTGTDPDTFRLRRAAFSAARPGLEYDAAGRLILNATAGGRYEARTASGRTVTWDVPQPQPSFDVEGPWRVRFPPGSGAPAEITLDALTSLSRHADPGVRYFSGTAVYSKTLTLDPAAVGPGKRLLLDLGDVQVMARVRLNGRDLGIAWRAPYEVDITDAARAGDNALEISVVNLWPNRLIGDEELPEDSERNSNGTLKSWPEWLLAGRPSPTGRLTFSSWRLWKKTDSLPASGLIGPIVVHASARLAAQ